MSIAWSSSRAGDESPATIISSVNDDLGAAAARCSSGDDDEVEEEDGRSLTSATTSPTVGAVPRRNNRRTHSDDCDDSVARTTPFPTLLGGRHHHHPQQRLRMPSFHTPDYVHLNGTASVEDSLGNGSPAGNGGGASVATMEDDSSLHPLATAVSFARRGSKPPTCWYRRTPLEKGLALTLAVCLLALLASVLALYGVSTSGGDNNAGTGALNDDTPWSTERRVGDDGSTRRSPSSTPLPADGVCTTSGCVKAAANLIQAIDPSVDPCQDFYQYACGRWNNENPIPDDMSSFGTFAYVRERVRKQIRVLLQTEDPNERSVAIKQSQTTYRACMNTRRLRQLNSSLLHRAYAELHHWPTIHGEAGVDEGGKWRRADYDLTRLLTSVRNAYGNEILFSIYVYADARNTTNNILYIDQSILGLGRGSQDYYLNDTMFGRHMRAYLSYITRVTLSIAGDCPQGGDGTAQCAKNDTSIKRSLRRILQFEKGLAAIVVKETDRRNHTRMYNKRTVGDLNKLLPEIRWIEYFRSTLPVGMEEFVNEDTPIIVCEESYLRNVSKLIQATDSRLITDYLLWRMTQAWVKNLDSRFDDIKQDFLRIMTGQQQKSPRWKDCAPAPVGFLPLAMGSLYVKHYFDTKDKMEALQMIDNLRASFTSIVNELDWMDQTTKTVAVAKAHSMVNHIGYPDFIRDPDKLDAYYAGLDIQEDDDYFNLVKKVINWTHKKEFRRLNQTFDKQEFEVSPAVVNAFYSPEKNAITFPAGILQPPFFSGDYPKSINYGAIGAVIGHEITHGFDDQGSQFDRHGNLHNWWSEEAYRRFDERKRCMVLQYDGYEVPGTNLNVNGQLTQGENIADNGGVKEAYKAYRMYIKTLGREEPRLPGMLNFTNDQLFFLSYAHFWCGHKKTAAAVQQVLTDEHSPETFRVIGVLSNLADFSRAFRCAVGTPLNPAKSDRAKCDVW